jgi:SAM-dependent methyltransferase
VNRPAWLRAIRSRLSGTKPPQSGADQPPEVAWQAAIDGEVGFWRNWLNTKGARFPGSYDRAFDADLPLQTPIADLLDAPEGSTVKLLDVGAGPLTFLGRKHPTLTLDITAVDALGRQYGELLDEAGVTPPVRTQPCESEKLSTVLPADSFDLVAARNTLDHSYDPVRAIDEMLACAKPGAPLVLVHHPNEAVREGYRGMHQWNFEVVNGEFMIWRPGTRTNVGETLAPRATVEKTWAEETWEYIVIRKAVSEASV